MQFELLRTLVPAFRRHDQVLDLACGEGDMIPALTGWIPGRRLSLRKYLGLDEDVVKVRRAQIRYPQATFRQSDTEILPAAYDHVFCAGRLHDPRAFDAAWRALKVGGTLLISEEEQTVPRSFMMQFLSRVLARYELRRRGFEIVKELPGTTLAFLAMKLSV